MSDKKYFVLFLLAAGLIFNFAIPPFQNPDEPLHFGMILTYVQNDRTQVEIEREILKIMDHNFWWNFVGAKRPATLKEGFPSLPFFKYPNFRAALEGRTLYHQAVGRFIRAFPLSATPSLYYLCRFLSFLLFSLAAYITFLTFRKIGAISREIYFAGFLFFLFLPQNLILALSVNSDAALLVLGSLFFYGALCIFTDGPTFINSGLVILTAGIGLFADKSSMYLCLILPLLFLPSFKRKNRLVTTCTILVLILVLLSWFVWYFPLRYYDLLARLSTALKLDFLAMLPGLFERQLQPQFFSLIIDSFLVKFGWMAFSPHKMFYMLWRMILVMGTIGAVLFSIENLRHGKKGKKPAAQSPAFSRFFFISVTALIIQVLAGVVFYGGRNIMVQGRHFFPLLIPISFLIILGLKYAWGAINQKAGDIAVPVFILLEFLFLNIVFWYYLIPVFHLTLKSPHPGL